MILKCYKKTVQFERFLKFKLISDIKLYSPRFLIFIEIKRYFSFAYKK